MNRVLIGTSWKMHQTWTEAVAWLRAVRPLLDSVDDRDLFVLPPFPAIEAARRELEGSAIGYGGQDVHAEDQGAHTGDVSAPMLADLGCRYVEVGHSERRRDHGETDPIVLAKVRAALRWDLTPIVCIGEQTRGRIDRARSVIETQLERGLGPLPIADLERVVLAYEPVWAIGDGAAAADSGHIEVIHAAIDAWLSARGAKVRRLIYGGSVNLANAADLLAVPRVGGLFVGRAALDPRTFAAIARIALPS